MICIMIKHFLRSLYVYLPIINIDYCYCLMGKDAVYNLKKKIQIDLSFQINNYTIL